MADKKKKKDLVVLPPGDTRLPGDPANCPVAPCPPDCPGKLLCKAVMGYDEPVDMEKIAKEIAERDKLHTQLTGDNNNSD